VSQINQSKFLPSRYKMSYLPFGKAREVELRENPQLNSDYGAPPDLNPAKEMKEVDENEIVRLEKPSKSTPESSVNPEEDEEEFKPNIKKDRFAGVKKLCKIPFFTPILILIQTALFIATIVVSVQRGEFGDFWSNPLVGPGTNVLVQFGARTAPLVTQNGGVWRLLVSMFLFTGVFHYLFSIMFELQVLVKLERTWGFLPVTAIWLFSGLGGNLASTIFLPNVVVVGSTTTLAGVTASMLAELAINWSNTRQKWKRLATCLLQCLIFLMMGFLPFIDNFSNLGGFITGLLVAFVLIPRLETAQTKLQKAWCWAINIWRPIAALIVGGLILTGFLMLYLDPQAAASCYPHGWCYYLNPDWDFFFGPEPV
jgi:membrane associated rhomboid family serine protease